MYVLLDFSWVIINLSMQCLRTWTPGKLLGPVFVNKEGREKKVFCIGKLLNNY